GAACRARIGSAAHELQAGLHAQSFTKNVFFHTATMGWDLFKNRHSATGVGMQTVLPLLINGISVLLKKPWRKRLSGVVLAFTVAGVVTSIMTGKYMRQSACDKSSHS
ncbi:MAG TPA: hypothetical protein VJ577_04730, partial [Burkholderiaceae bacterium]|nr:hypothetical protein [Burkholderiaceae bacterium]